MARFSEFFDRAVRRFRAESKQGEAFSHTFQPLPYVGRRFAEEPDAVKNPKLTGEAKDQPIPVGLLLIGISFFIPLASLTPKARGRWGFDAARAAGFEKIKLNAVLMRHRNEHELWDLADFARERGLMLRFIELMPVSSTEVLTEQNFLSVGEAKKLLAFRLGELRPRPDIRTNGPASYYEVAATGQILGFIGAMTNLHFCETCNKLRLTCEGKLRPCLGSHLEFDLRPVLRDPAMSDEDVARFFREVVARKPEQHDFRENYQPGRKMIAIGG